MLDDAAFAFLILTAEDQHADEKLHARENVVHEAGFFQGRLGFKKATLLLEETCEKFSNIDGLGHIPFPPGKINAAFEEIRKVPEREDRITSEPKSGVAPLPVASYRSAKAGFRTLPRARERSRRQGWRRKLVAIKAQSQYAARPQFSPAGRRGGALRPRRDGRRRGQAPVRGEADGFEDHRDAALDVVGADGGEGAAGVGPAAAPAVIGQSGLVGGVIGVGEFVVLGFGDPSEGDAQPAPQADALVFETAGQLPGNSL